MTDQLENALQAVSNSLTRIVGPAVSEADPLAQQQLTLSLAYLDLIRERMPHLAAHEQFELEANLSLARAVEPHVPEQIATALDELREDAERALHDRTGAGSAPRQLSARIQALVSEAFETAPAEAAAALEQAVLTASRRRVELDRAWFLPMGFDPDPDTVRPLAEVLAGREGAAS